MAPRNEIDFYQHECEGYKPQYAHLAEIMSKHEANMKVERDAFVEIKAAQYERERMKKEARTVTFQ